MTNPRKILLLFAHPAQHRSQVNVVLFEAAKQLSFVTTVDLYALYPTFDIHIDNEQQRLMEHDIIVLQFPLYWYSTPAILKEWQDQVLEYGFAYGTGGDALHGKTMLCATTAGGSEQDYKPGGINTYSIRELMRPLEQTANLAGMSYLPPLMLFDARTAKDEGRVTRHVAAWQTLLSHLHNGTLDMAKARDIDYLGSDISPLLTGAPTAAKQTTSSAKEAQP